MSRAPEPIDADRLLAEGRSLRALARTLVGADAADDVVHDACVAALQQRSVVARPGAWLTGVVMRLAARLRRTNARRSSREQRTGRIDPDAATDPARIAEQAETLRAIASAVHDLDEPFRTVIVLRFWDDASPRDIAARLGVPAATVRTRLHRGIDRLRVRLDTDRGGRDAWRRALVALAAPRRTAATVLPLAAFAGVLMNVKLLGGAVAAAALVFALAPTWPQGGTDAPAAGVPAIVAAPAAAAASAPTAEGRPARVLVAPPERTPPTGSDLVADDDRVAPWRLQVVVEDTGQKPVADATVCVWAGRRALGRSGYTGRLDVQLTQLRTDALGRAEAEVDRLGVMVGAERGRAISTEHFAFRDRAVPPTVLTIREKLSVQGRVVRPDGSSAARATVTAKGELANTGSMGFSPSPPSATAGDDGAFELLVAPRCRYVLQAADGDAVTFPLALTTRDEPLANLVLAFPGAVSVRGLVVDADGTPVAAASVRVWRDVGGNPQHHTTEQRWLRTGSDGRFASDLQELARYGLLATAANQPASHVQWIEPSAEHPHVEVRVGLTRFSPITGTVRTSRGEAIANARVHASAGPLDAAARPEPDRRERFTTAGTTTTDEHGRFELRVHPGTSWTLVVTPDPAAPNNSLRRLDVAPGTRDLVIVATEDELHGCAITGISRSRDGAPWSDFEAKLQFTDEDALVPLRRPLRATFDGANFVLPVMGVGREVAIVLEPTATSPFAPQHFGPFRTTRAGIHLLVTPQVWATVPVRLRSADGALRPGLRVSLSPDEPTANWDTASTAVDTDGRAVLRQRAPGENTLHVVADARVIHTQPATLVPGANAEIVVTLPGSTHR